MMKLFCDEPLERTPCQGEEDLQREIKLAIEEVRALMRRPFWSPISERGEKGEQCDFCEREQKRISVKGASAEQSTAIPLCLEPFE